MKTLSKNELFNVSAYIRESIKPNGLVKPLLPNMKTLSALRVAHCSQKCKRFQRCLKQRNQAFRAAILKIGIVDL
jgi:hypothetical protein